MNFYIGRQGEKFVKKIFEEAGIDCEDVDTENQLYYDILCKYGNRSFTIEVKFDIKAQTTGNLAIEVFNSYQNKPSGLTSTKADFWVHVILDGDNKTAWLCPVPQLREFINSCSPKKVIERGGDKNASLLLYDVDIILAEFTQIDILSPEALMKLVKKLNVKKRKPKTGT